MKGRCGVGAMSGPRLGDSTGRKYLPYVVPASKGGMDTDSGLHLQGTRTCRPSAHQAIFNGRCSDAENIDVCKLGQRSKCCCCPCQARISDNPRTVTRFLRSGARFRGWSFDNIRRHASGLDWRGYELASAQPNHRGL